jgi:hypothetical protein
MLDEASLTRSSAMAPTPGPPPSIADHLQRLLGVLEHAEDRSQRLHQRIEPVLRPSAVADAIETAPMPASSDLAGSLQAITERVRVLGVRLDDLGDRVDL